MSDTPKTPEAPTDIFRGMDIEGNEIVLQETPLTNREAVALMMALNNVLHSSIHLTLLTAEQAMLFQAAVQSDFVNLVQGEKVKIHFHDNATISLEDASAKKVQWVINQLVLGALLNQQEDKDLPQSNAPSSISKN